MHRHLIDELPIRLLLIAVAACLLAADAPRLVGLVALGLAVAFVVEIAAAHLPAWRAADMVPIGIVCFALLLERAGMAPSSVAFILVSSLGLDDHKPAEIVVNTVMLGLFSLELAQLLR